MRSTVKAVAFGIATALVAPALVSFHLRRKLWGADRAIAGSAEAFGVLPGMLGMFLRRAFFARALDHCAGSATIGFGTLFSQAGARIDEGVYVGPGCQLGLVHLERNVLLASGVHVPSGADTHGTADLDTPIREQPGLRRMVTIGEGTWVGSGAIIMADIGRHCVVGAGAVVTCPVPDYAVAVGVPARVVRDRRTGLRPDHGPAPVSRRA